MKRNYKFFLFLVASLTTSPNILFFSLSAASEEVQILPPQILPICPEKLPILEADNADTGTNAISAVNAAPSSTGSGSVTPLTVPKTDPTSITGVPLEVPKTEQISKTNPAPKVSHSILTSTPLSVPPIEPPTASGSTSLVKPSYKSLPLAPPSPISERQIEPLAQSVVIPASPSLPPVAKPSAESTTEIPHTRYLSMPANSFSDTAISEVSENKPPNLEPELPVNTSTESQATIACVPAITSTPVVDSAQTEVLPETDKTESPALSPNNSGIEKSIENSERSLKGLRPF